MCIKGGSRHDAILLPERSRVKATKSDDAIRRTGIAKPWQMQIMLPRNSQSQLWAKGVFKRGCVKVSSSLHCRRLAAQRKTSRGSPGLLEVRLLLAMALPGGRMKRCDERRTLSR